MKQLTCACLPSEASGKKIRKLMKEVSSLCHSKNALAFPPHFSLRGDFKVKESDLSPLFSELDRTLSSHPALKLKLEDYGFYPWHIIYLNIEKNKSLQELHETAMDLIQKYRTGWIPDALKDSKRFSGKQREYIEKYGYHFAFEYFSPHFTLAGNDMDENVFQEMKRKLRNKKEQIEVTIDKVVLLDRNNSNQIIKEIKLNDFATSKKQM